MQHTVRKAVLFYLFFLRFPTTSRHYFFERKKEKQLVCKARIFLYICTDVIVCNSATLQFSAMSDLKSFLSNVAKKCTAVGLTSPSILLYSI